jgi:hypothetical protein
MIYLHIEILILGRLSYGFFYPRWKNKLYGTTLSTFLCLLHIILFFARNQIIRMINPRKNLFVGDGTIEHDCIPVFFIHVRFNYTM